MCQITEMDSPPISLRPSPWVLLATAAVILVFAGIASMHHPPPRLLGALGGAGAMFAGLAMLARRMA
jgi:hypothetical protein